MSFSKRAFTISSAVLLAIGLAWIYFSAAPSASAVSATSASTTQPRKGFYAPDFELKTLDGQTVRLSALRGKPVILNAWASWCGPCQAEMPALQKVYSEYKDQGLQVVAVNMTFQDTRADAAAFVASHGLTFPIPLDTFSDVGKKYLVSALPSSYFIGSNGIIVDVIIGGPVDEATFRAQAEFLLKEAN